MRRSATRPDSPLTRLRIKFLKEIPIAASHCDNASFDVVYSDSNLLHGLAVCCQSSVADQPRGQRCVTFFVRVKKRMLSSPYWLRSPKAESFQPPWL